MIIKKILQSKLVFAYQIVSLYLAATGVEQKQIQISNWYFFALQTRNINFENREKKLKKTSGAKYKQPKLQLLLNVSTI